MAPFTNAIVRTGDERLHRERHEPITVGEKRGEDKRIITLQDGSQRLRKETKIASWGDS